MQKLCQFLGQKLEPDELNSLLKHSSFQVMKENKMSNYTLLPSNLLDHERGSFLRKGKRKCDVRGCEEGILGLTVGTRECLDLAALTARPLEDVSRALI